MCYKISIFMKVHLIIYKLSQISLFSWFIATQEIVSIQIYHINVFLRLSGELWQNTTDWVIYKQQAFFPHISRDWKFQDQVTCMVIFWEGPSSCFTVCPFSLVPHLIEEVRILCRASFIRTLIAFMKAPFSWPKHLPIGLTF